MAANIIVMPQKKTAAAKVPIEGIYDHYRASILLLLEDRKGQVYDRERMAKTMAGVYEATRKAERLMEHWHGEEMGRVMTFPVRKG